MTSIRKGHNPSWAVGLEQLAPPVDWSKPELEFRVPPRKSANMSVHEKQARSVNKRKRPITLAKVSF